MEFAASILPFIAASICLVFSLHFLITAFTIQRDRLFLGLFLLLLVLAVNQLAVGMQVHLFPGNAESSFFWYRIKFAALALLIFMTVYYFYMLAARRVNAPITYVFFFICIVLAVLTFTPIFGTYAAAETRMFVFSPRIGGLAVLALLAMSVLFFVVILVGRLAAGRKSIKARSLFWYILGGILLLGLGILEIMAELAVISPAPVKYSSFGAIIMSLIGGAVVLVRFCDARASLKNILINLNETEREIERKEQLAITDGLTGLYNRGFFDESIEEEVKDSIKNNKSLSLIMLDIDGFKRVNDTLGNIAGDNVLAEIANVIKRGARGSDLPARFGGEEFAVILPNTNVYEAHEVGERIRRQIEEINFIVDDKPETFVTISVGVATLRGTDLAKDLLNRADKALVAAKRQGKNNVCIIK